jgi:hypothetical protein
MKLYVATLLSFPVALATSLASAQDLPEPPAGEPAPRVEAAPRVELPHRRSVPAPTATAADPGAAVRDAAPDDGPPIDSDDSDDASSSESASARVSVSHIEPLAPTRAQASEPAAVPSARPSSAAEIAAPTLNQPPAPDAVDEEPEFDFFSHGFRLGYLYLVNHDCRLQGTDPDSCVDMTEKYDVKRPHFFVLGYELTQRVRGSSWLNVLFVENILLSGLEQSLFLPSLNTLLGFEFYDQVQIGVGINLVPSEFKPAHMIMAIGWTPKVGNINVPIHFAFIPDVDNQHRLAATSGVNW